MDRIASFNHTRLLITQALKVQTKVAEAQIQESTGVESTTYDGISDNARALLQLESEMAQADQYVANGEIVASRLDTMYSAIGNLVTVATDARSFISSALSGVDDGTDSITLEAETALEEAASLLNTQMDGRYLFGGSRTDAAPVDLSAYTAASTTDTSYYQGDDTVLSYQSAPDAEIDYGVTADEDGFEKLIRGLTLAANASTDPLDTDALEDAYDLVSEAMDDIATLQAGVSASADRVEQAINANLDYQLYSQSIIEDLKSVDVAEVTANLSALETQLEASYSVVTALQKMNLLDYL